METDDPGIGGAEKAIDEATNESQPQDCRTIH
jgi:hypothetical protein